MLTQEGSQLKRFTWNQTVELSSGKIGRIKDGPPSLSEEMPDISIKAYLATVFSSMVIEDNILLIPSFVLKIENHTHFFSFTTEILLAEEQSADIFVLNWGAQALEAIHCVPVSQRRTTCCFSLNIFQRCSSLKRGKFFLSPHITIKHFRSSIPLTHTHLSQHISTIVRRMDCRDKRLYSSESSRTSMPQTPIALYCKT